jgi:hypothetical protein
MNFLPKPTESVELATLQGGKARAVYSVFGDNPRVPNEFTISKGSRCLIQLFDAEGHFYENMILAFDQLDSQGAKPERVASERLLFFALGRGSAASSSVFGMPELERDLAGPSASIRRNSVWSMVRLKGWSRPSVLILQRIFAATTTRVSKGSRSTYNWARLSVEDADRLRQGLLQHGDFLSASGS